MLPFTLNYDDLFSHLLPGGEGGLVPRPSSQTPPPPERAKRRPATREPAKKPDATPHVVLAPEQLKARLAELQAAVAQARDVMDSVYAETQEENDKGEKRPSPGTVKKWKNAVDTWRSVRDEMAEVEDQLRKVGQLPLPGMWLGRRKQVISELEGQYGDHGPQYRMLVEMVASKKVRLEMMERSGSFGAEYDQLAKGVRDDIAQLQRYTEATKSEAIHREVNDACAMVISVFERLLHDQPGLFKRAVSEIVRMVESGGGSGIMGTRQLPPPVIIDGEVMDA